LGVSAAIPTLAYLTFDPVSRGVGASQVQPYVSRLRSRGVAVEVQSFEGDRFGRPGALGGLGRVARGALAVRGAGLAHARAHMAGAACVLGRSRRWLWDVRSLWIDERIESGMLRRGSVEEKVLRRLERRAARSCDAVVTLSAAAVPALSSLAEADLSAKASVIPTCVDLSRFKASPLVVGDGPVRLLLSGSLNALYDVPSMIAFASAVGRLRPVSLERVGGGGSPWESALADVTREELAFAQMPSRLAAAHAGLCLQFESSVSAVAAAPIKVAEFLACGRPVVVSSGLGDLPALVRAERCGVVVSDGNVDLAAEELCALVEDPELVARCRAVAERHFDLEWAVDKLLSIYAAIAGSDANA
jgi:glycosyltransferase involved in cell wall biosynthesis